MQPKQRGYSSHAEQFISINHVIGFIALVSENSLAHVLDLKHITLNLAYSRLPADSGDRHVYCWIRVD